MHSESTLPSVRCLWRIVSNVSLNPRISALEPRFISDSVWSVASSANVTLFWTFSFFNVRNSSDFRAWLSTASKIFCFLALTIPIIWSTFFSTWLSTSATCIWISMIFWLYFSTSFRSSSTFSFKDAIVELICDLRASVASCKSILSWPSWSVTTQVLQTATLQSLQ